MSAGANSSNAQVRSIAWMLRCLAESGKFQFDDWSAEFGTSRRSEGSSRDRTFFRHLELLKSEFLAIVSPRAELTGAEGIYSLRGQSVEGRFEGVLNHESANFLPFLHALSERRSLLPFVAPEVEAQLRKELEASSSDLGRVLYKTRTEWRLDRRYLTNFLDAVHLGAKLKVVPAGHRPPALVTPLFLVSYEGAWHLVSLADRVEQYNLSRVAELEVTETPADEVAASSLAALRRSILAVFGIYLVTPWEAPESGEQATVRYHRGAAVFARERFDLTVRTDTDPWFRVADNKDFVDVTVRVHSGGYGELIGEVLRWGPDAEALAPMAFRDLWKQQVKALQVYLEIDPPTDIQ